MAIMATTALCVCAGCTNRPLDPEASPSSVSAIVEGASPTPDPQPTPIPSSPSEGVRHIFSKHDDAVFQAEVETLHKKLSEPERVSIFKEIVEAEDGADADAKREIPDPPDDLIKVGDVYQRQENLKSQLEEKADARLARRLGITEDQLYLITAEGVDNHWNH